MQVSRSPPGKVSIGPFHCRHPLALLLKDYFRWGWGKSKQQFNDTRILLNKKFELRLSKHRTRRSVMTPRIDSGQIGMSDDLTGEEYGNLNILKGQYH